ncbi:MAG: lipase chaperone [Deltaproteobacteria bacterium]|nr:lipase chaperone [Deltaproteobacteria bacterium]
MTNKKLVAFCGIGILLALVIFITIHILTDKIEERYTQKHYIFDKDFRSNQKKPDSSTSKYFSDGMVTVETLNFFRIIERRFAVQSIKQLNEHFNEVGKYLHSQFKESEAQRLFEIYKKYLKCEIEIGTNQKYRAKTPDPKLILALLYKIQNVRRDRLGKEIADALFGSEVKEREYLLRRAITIGDSTLYGKEKESRLQTLKRDMWDGEDVFIGDADNPYNRFQLKMQLYQKDLSELDDREYKFKIEEFRREFFSQEQIKKLHEVDEQFIKEKEKMERYRAAEKKILDARNMTREEKDKQIKALQDKFFGKDAEAFRRREIMYGGAKK